MTHITRFILCLTLPGMCLYLAVLLMICLSGCAQDRHRVDGHIIKVRGEYYRLNNTMGNVYALEPVYMDTIIIVK
jgi:hypothetical protein